MYATAKSSHVKIRTTVTIGYQNYNSYVNISLYIWHMHVNRYTDHTVYILIYRYTSLGSYYCLILQALSKSSGKMVKRSNAKIYTCNVIDTTWSYQSVLNRSGMNSSLNTISIGVISSCSTNNALNVLAYIVVWSGVVVLWTGRPVPGCHSFRHIEQSILWLHCIANPFPPPHCMYIDPSECTWTKTRINYAQHHRQQPNEMFGLTDEIFLSNWIKRVYKCKG